MKYLLLIIIVIMNCSAQENSIHRASYFVLGIYTEDFSDYNLITLKDYSDSTYILLSLKQSKKSIDSLLINQNVKEIVVGKEYCLDISKLDSVSFLSLSSSKYRGHPIDLIYEGIQITQEDSVIVNLFESLNIVDKYYIDPIK